MIIRQPGQTPRSKRTYRSWRRNWSIKWFGVETKEQVRKERSKTPKKK